MVKGESKSESESGRVKVLVVGIIANGGAIVGLRDADSLPTSR